MPSPQNNSAQPDPTAVPTFATLNGTNTAQQQGQQAVTKPLAAAGEAKANSSKTNTDALLLTQTITRAEEIVLRTKDDPFQQVQELERLKAEYMRVRYDHILKVAEN
jgi:hypothetical protein